ncbi:MAG: hypothetical protein QOF03_104 [Alphaproteobacteria bacterium]|jgi:predicted dithiol-disulfide oxidoreductase (DUF899 family)|nr:hypothetical protein [Alphaproteobacteria bacterium]
MEHRVVSHDEWLKERKALLAEEKEFNCIRDALSKNRRELPWERVEKDYLFDGPNGKETLAQLFGRKSQLIVYHFMFDPEWDEGCKSCSFWADNFNGIDIHLAHRDVRFVAISRAPLAKLEAYRKRMGWSFKWLSSFGSDFNHDHYVTFTPEEMATGTGFHNYTRSTPPISETVGVSVFYKDEKGRIFHTYSTYSRGVDMLNGAYHYLDLAPEGRDEDKLSYTQEWVRRHDQYED